MIIAEILLFYLPIAAIAVSVIYTMLVGSAFDNCFKRLEKDLPLHKPTTVYGSWDYPRVIKLAEKEHPAIGQRMKYLFRLQIKGLVAIFICVISFAIGATILEAIKVEPDNREVREPPAENLTE